MRLVKLKQRIIIIALALVPVLSGCAAGSRNVPASEQPGEVQSSSTEQQRDALLSPER